MYYVSILHRIPYTTVEYTTETYFIEMCIRDSTRAIASIVPQVKKHPQPMYGSRSGCYSQACVDGQGYDCLLYTSRCV